MAESKGHLLVVDDDPEIVEMISLSFQERGYTVQTATDGGNAAMKVRSAHYDAIITDLKLPSMNGLQVVAVAKATSDNAETPVFVVSGYLDAETIKRSVSMNVTELLTKPFDMSTLLDKVSRAVGKNKKVAPSYDARIINAFVKGAAQVLAFYFGKDPEISKPAIKRDLNSRGAVTGLIGFMGGGVIGSMALSSDRPMIKSLAGAYFPGMDVPLDEKLQGDIAGETCNQVVGKVKINLSALGLKVAIGLPEILRGEPHEVLHKTTNPVLAVELKMPGGTCFLEFAMVAGNAEAKLEEGKADVVGDVVLF